MQRLKVSGAVRPLYGPLGVKGLRYISTNSTIYVPRECSCVFSVVQRIIGTDFVVVTVRCASA
jgi:hypothetical protein